MAKKKAAKKRAKQLTFRLGKRDDTPEIYPDVPQIIDRSKISFFLSREGLGNAILEEPELIYKGKVVDLPKFGSREDALDVVHFFTRRPTDLPDDVARSIALMATGRLRITVRPSGTTVRKEEHWFDVLLIEGPH